MTKSCLKPKPAREMRPLRHAIRKVILRFSLAEVLEGQHGDGGPIGQRMGHLLDGGDLGGASGNEDKTPEEPNGNDEEDPCGQGDPAHFFRRAFLASFTRWAAAPG